MIRTRALSRIAASAALLLPSGVFAQSALPTAERTLQLSAFGGLSGVFTRLSGGKNLDILAGADLGLPPVRHVRPEIEVRGVYPMDGGTIDAQKSILVGLKADFLLNHRLQPYGDFLFGRGEIHYRNGYQLGSEIYLLTTTNVYSFGGGLEYPVSRWLELRLDGQLQKWGYAPTVSTNLYPVVASAGVVYRFGR